MSVRQLAEQIAEDAARYGDGGPVTEERVAAVEEWIRGRLNDLLFGRCHDEALALLGE